MGCAKRHINHLSTAGQNTDGELLAVVSSRVSHALRTPLNVLFGLFEDSLKGHKLSTEDFADGLGAVKAAFSGVEMLWEFSRSLEEHMEEIELCSFLASSVAGLATNDELPEATFSSDVALLKGSVVAGQIEYVLRQTLQISRQYGTGADRTVRVQLVSGNSRATQQGGFTLLIEIPAELICRGDCPTGVLTPTQVVAQNHSLNVLRMLLIERVALRHGGSCYVEAANNATLLTLGFPAAR